MTDLTAFLNARLDEDEAAAKAATPGEWYITGEDILTRADDPHWNGACAANASFPDAAHIARHDPARGLREVAAKRAIIAEYQGATAITGEDDQYAAGLGMAIKALAAIWRDHPDYRKEWAGDQ